LGGVVSSLYQRAVLTGNLATLEATDAVIDEAIRRIRLPGDLYFLKAKLAFQLHRFGDARRCLEAVPSLPTSAEGRALQADIEFQKGRYREARQEYERVLADNRTWDNLARLAYFEAKLGDAVLADRLYAEAEDELTAKQMRSYAWVELQKGAARPRPWPSRGSRHALPACRSGLFRSLARRGAQGRAARGASRIRGSRHLL
jgi:tetratricopeptide (TPR) repeat protein